MKQEPLNKLPKLSEPLKILAHATKIIQMITLALQEKLYHNNL